MCILDGVVEQTCGDESGGVRHVDHEDGTDLVGQVAHAGIVPLAAVCAGAAYDEAGTLAACHLLHLLVVNEPGGAVYVILEGLEHEAREIDGASVAQVAAVAQVEAQELVAGLQACHEHGHVGLCARVGLHVGPLGAEELLEPLDGQALHLVDYLAASVIAVARITLGIFVGEARTHCAHHVVAHEILGGYQLDAFLLALVLALDDVKYCLVSFHWLEIVCIGYFFLTDHPNRPISSPWP